MNNQRIDGIIREYADNIEEESLGYWRYTYRGQVVLTITDEAHNRMRIICPIALSKDVNDQQLRVCMEANFDRALDARYAISGDYLWSAFIHPLTELTDSQFINALEQAVTLAANYGTTFSSGDLLFGDGAQ